MTDLINAIKLIYEQGPTKPTERILIVSDSAYKAAEMAVKINEVGFSKIGDDIYFLQAKIVKAHIDDI